MMRIVGQNSKHMFIQIKSGKEWEQSKISYEEFEKLMNENYPKYYEEYLSGEMNTSFESFCYSYGEEGSKDTYIFV